MPEFQIGTTLGGMQDLEDLFPASLDLPLPDWSFQPFAEYRDLADGTRKGQGFPVVIWRFNHLSEWSRQAVKDLISGLSGPVYIQTPTNEIDIYGARVWKTYLGILKWTPEDEDKAADRTLGIVLTFTHLEEQS